MSWMVYVLRCRNGQLYIGVTTDVDRRLAEHRAGIGGRFTRANRPLKIVYQEPYSSQAEATARESQIKRWSRPKKLALLAGNHKALKAA